MTGTHARYPQATVDRFVSLRVLGKTNEVACKEVGINKKTGEDWWQKHKRNSARMRGGDAMPDPKSRTQINKSAASRKAFVDFAYFRLKVFGFYTPPWQRVLAEEMREAVESSRREYLCVNVFPGAGKTTFYQHFIAWMIVRNRTKRFMWVSANEAQAVRRVNHIREALAATEPLEPNQDDLEQGRAVRPKHCIAALFGRFRPSGHHHVPWQAGEFTVSTVRPQGGEGPPSSGPTLLAFGRGSQLLGNRAEFVVGDDVWTQDADNSPETGRDLKGWWDRTLENRLQPSGVCCLVMQRMSGDDISHYVLGKQMPVLDPETGVETGWEPEYRHVVFPAHHDDLCDGTHPAGRPGWDPEKPKKGHCLTDPLALPPQDYVRKKGQPMFRVVYQQEDVDPAAQIIREVWLTGGKDEDGSYRGCLDYDRGLWEPPEGVPTSALASAMSIDVGHENYWGLYSACHDIRPDNDMEWVLCADHRRMPAGTEKGLLDWDFHRGVFVGLLDEWYERSKDAGVPFTHIIAEANAAQRHLFRQMNVVDKWQKARNCRILPHETTKVKNDKKLGVEAMLPMRYQLGAFRIPWRPGEAQTTMRTLYNEAKGYTGVKGHQDDVVMAQWMRCLNRRRIVKPLAAVPDGSRSDVPKWLQQYGRGA